MLSSFAYHSLMHTIGANLVEPSESRCLLSAISFSYNSTLRGIHSFLIFYVLAQDVPSNCRIKSTFLPKVVFIRHFVLVTKKYLAHHLIYN